MVRNVVMTAIPAVLALSLVADFATATSAKAMNGQDGIDAARLPVCLALPGSGVAAQEVLPSSEWTAVKVSQNGSPSDCKTVLARLAR